MTGIIEIAEQAKVSIATVSRVLRNPELVSKKTRDRVLEVIARTGYTPNNLGVSLRKSKTHNLVAIIPDAISAFNYPVIRSIESIALQHGYSLLLGDTQESETRERWFANMVRSRQADGILLFCSRLPFDINNNLPVSTQLPPLVSACEWVHVEGIPHVNIDNVKASEDAMHYLFSLGHKRIAAVTGNMLSDSTKQRLTGYRQALSSAGISYDETLVEVGNYSLTGAAEATKKLANLSQRPTAIFAFSDEMAMSCIFTLQKMNLEVPADVSVIGFDGIAYGNYITPTLTTIVQPMADIGTICMEMLLPQLQGEPMQPITRILDHSLEVRASTGVAKSS